MTETQTVLHANIDAENYRSDLQRYDNDLFALLWDDFPLYLSLPVADRTQILHDHNDISDFLHDTAVKMENWHDIFTRMLAKLDAAALKLDNGIKPKEGKQAKL